MFTGTYNNNEQLLRMRLDEYDMCFVENPKRRVGFSWKTQYGKYNNTIIFTIDCRRCHNIATRQ